MAFESLRWRTGERVSSVKLNAMIDAIEETYWLAKRGDPDTPFEELYAEYGYFSGDLFVQGKQVLKDGDPINVYDIFEPAKQKISQAIDYTSTAQYIREVRDKVLSIRIDQYGNVGVVIAQPLDQYGRIPVSVEDAFKPVSAKGSISAANNRSGFSITLFTGGRPNVNIYYKLSGAGNIYVKVSNDGVDWKTFDVISLPSADEKVKVYTGLAFQFIRVETDSTGIDVTFEVSAGR